ncbi:MAG: RelA/SpoT family protein [Holosporaceae bacterium]|nr:RelA/SpoT family protein [Holosporaceae bacterium]
MLYKLFFLKCENLITPQELVAQIKEYDVTVDEDYVKEAYLFSLYHHGTQIRSSGEPYFSHPLEVASILVDLKMDVKTVVSGLLHDTIEDTATTIDEIETKFGKEVAEIVNGVTKLSKFDSTSATEKQIENFKKLLLSSSANIKILIVKLVDRLHNMRTLKFRPRKKRKRTAKETIEIYAPLAERMGMQTIKDELQDLSFLELYPTVYNSIRVKLKELYEKSIPVMDTIAAILKSIAEETGVEAVVNGRMKTPYSIWQKLNKRNISFDQLADIMAFRMIVKSVSSCYQILGIIHQKYVVVPGRFRDYISVPKNNGYQSLHTSVIGPLNEKIEIQIRTKEMHEISEYGIAAHWMYKQLYVNEDEGTSGDFIGRHSKEQNWLRNLAEALDNITGLEEFIEHSRKDLLSDQIFCITPKGSIIPLPCGATVLDFAYAIHSDVGNQAVDAKVNNKKAALNKVLNNGDRVEIIIDSESSPDSVWRDYVTTLKAKASIEKNINKLYGTTNILKAKNEIDLFFADKINKKLSNREYQLIAKYLNFSKVNSLFIAVNKSEISLDTILEAHKFLSNSNSWPILGLPQNYIAVSNSGCCSPVFGDIIVGRVFSAEKQVEIHISNCQGVSKTANDNIIDLHWNHKAISKNNTYKTRFLVTINCLEGNLASAIGIVEKLNIDIVSITIGNKYDNFMTLMLEVKISDVSKVNAIRNTLWGSDFVTDVTRT